MASDDNEITEAGGFLFNKPTIVAILYIVSLLTALPLLIGVILAYVWRGEPHPDWEDSHYRFHIRTFWIGIAWGIIGIITIFVGIGLLILALLGVWLAVRSIKAMLAAQREAPVLNVETWLF